MIQDCKNKYQAEKDLQTHRALRHPSSKPTSSATSATSSATGTTSTAPPPLVRQYSERIGWEIKLANLELGRVLGKGGFGVVYLATYKGDTVAVKQVKASHGHKISDADIAGASSRRRRDAHRHRSPSTAFKAEATLMEQLPPHRNVIGLVRRRFVNTISPKAQLGVVSVAEPLCIVTEARAGQSTTRRLSVSSRSPPQYCALGSLDVYLRDRHGRLSPSHHVAMMLDACRVRWSGDARRSLTATRGRRACGICTRTVLCIAISRRATVSCTKVCARSRRRPSIDVAATDGHLLIADFGMSRLLAEGNDASRTKATTGPIRYMAPECMVIVATRCRRRCALALTRRARFDSGSASIQVRDEDDGCCGFDARRSTASDAWSFGVLMWEIASGGATPCACGGDGRCGPAR